MDHYPIATTIYHLHIDHNRPRTKIATTVDHQTATNTDHQNGHYSGPPTLHPLSTTHTAHTIDHPHCLRYRPPMHIDTMVDQPHCMPLLSNIDALLRIA